jgi:hypothetical protein
MDNSPGSLSSRCARRSTDASRGPKPTLGSWIAVANSVPFHERYRRVSNNKSIAGLGDPGASLGGRVDHDYCLHGYKGGATR